MPSTILLPLTNPVFSMLVMLVMLVMSLLLLLLLLQRIAAKCKTVWKSQLNNSATLNSHTDPSRCSQIGWVQSDELSGAPKQLHRCSSMFQELWNRIQEYPEECMVVFEMLQSQTIRMCIFRSYQEYWPRLQDCIGASRTWSCTFWEWLL